MTEPMITPMRRHDPAISFLITYQPNSDVGVWVRSRATKKQAAGRFHATTIAQQLSMFITFEIERAYRSWCGITPPYTSFEPPVEYLISDPEGIRDAYLFVAIPKCLEDDWQRLYELVRKESYRVARQYRGMVLTYHSCTKGPAR